VNVKIANVNRFVNVNVVVVSKRFFITRYKSRRMTMKSILTGILSLFIFFGSVPTAQASDMSNEAGMEEVKKKKKKGKKIGGSKGKKKKKGFFSKVFGSK